MRKLTIRRRGSAVSRSRSVKIYVEDPAGDMSIAGFKCRLLGEVQNNSRVTFEIPCERVRIFAIFGKLNKSYCNDYCIIPEGEEDCLVLGYCKFDRVTGHPFRFEGVTEEEILENREKCAEKGMAVTMTWLFVTVFILMLATLAIILPIVLLT